MDEYRKDDREKPPEIEKVRIWEDRAPSGATRWLVILSVLFMGVVVAAFGYAYEQNTAITELNIQNQTMHSQMAAMRNQLDMMAAKLDRTSETTYTAAPDSTTGKNASATTGPSASQAARAFPLARTTAQDRRIRQLQADLNVQKTQLKHTQDDVASAKSDFDGKLGSTRDELNGSIAKTHDELVALSKRGERRFYEFDLPKSKTFQREGPIQVSLRKADAKHQSYDLVMLVDDHQLSKKKVNLYEPVWLHQADQPEPIQVVVNKIDKDRIHGYISAPRYSESQISANAFEPEQDFTSHPAQRSSSSSSPSNSPSSTSTSTPATSPEDQPGSID